MPLHSRRHQKNILKVGSGEGAKELDIREEDGKLIFELPKPTAQPEADRDEESKERPE